MDSTIGRYTIYITTPDGVIPLDVKLDNTVSDVYTLLNEQSSNLWNYSLTFGGQHLNNSDLLSDIGIASEAKLVIGGRKKHISISHAKEYTTWNEFYICYIRSFEPNCNILIPRHKVDKVNKMDDVIHFEGDINLSIHITLNVFCKAMGLQEEKIKVYTQPEALSLFNKLIKINIPLNLFSVASELGQDSCGETYTLTYFINNIVERSDGVYKYHYPNMLLGQSSINKNAGKLVSVIGTDGDYKEHYAHKLIPMNFLLKQK